jgi:hypothetical protein
MYGRAEAILRMPNATLRNLAWVAKSWELSRRRDNLEWSHHRELCALDTQTQRTKWAETAEKEKLPVHRLRRSIAAGRVLTPEESAHAGKRAHPTFTYYVKEIMQLVRKYDEEAAWDLASTEVLRAELHELEQVVRVHERISQMILERLDVKP